MMKIDNLPWELMAKAKGTNKTASGPIVSINDALAAPLRSLRVAIDPVQAGTGDPGPDNVRPISGWSEVNVCRTGKNVCKSYVAGENLTRFAVALFGELDLRPETTYTLSFVGVVGQSFYVNENIAEFKDFTVVDGRTSVAIKIKAFIDRNEANQYRDGFGWILLKNNIAQSSAIVFQDVQIELGSTATPYEPYSGNQYTIQLGQTVYGGYISVSEDGNAELVVDRASVTVDGSDAFTYQANGHTDYSARAYIPITGKKYGIDNMISDKFVYAALGDFYGKMVGRASTIGIEFFLPPEVPNVSADIKQWFADNHTQVVYKLATPITIPLTPMQISTLQGANNLWADSGDVMIAYKSNSPDKSLMKLAIAFINRR